MNKTLVIIGGGPAGLAAALAAKKEGAQDILIIERDGSLGGILNQCIHNGFGLQVFNQELTGPEYAHRYVKAVTEAGIRCLTETMVTDLSPDKTVTAVNRSGVIKIKAGAVILACGCRERPRGALNTAGTRPSGIFSAGTAQRLVNIEGRCVGSEAVILGSGDIGLIMARRMTYSGARVRAVVEIMPYSSGLNRNIVQCLNDFDIPLLLSHTVTQIHGRERIEGVTLAQTDQNRRPIESTKRFMPCDTLLLSVGLIPENELAKKAGIELSGITGGAVVDNTLMTSAEGIFACGNVLHVHDLVDYVSAEAERAGINAARYLQAPQPPSAALKVNAGAGVRYTVPQMIDVSRVQSTLRFILRSDDVYKNVLLCAAADGREIFCKKRAIITPGESEAFEVDFDKIRNAQSVQVYIKKAEGHA